MENFTFGNLSPAVLAKLLHVGGNVALAAIAFVGVLAAGRFATALLDAAARRQARHAALLAILGRATWTAAIIVACLSALENLGLNVTALVTSLGLAGLTLGFALRDIATSFVAGLLIIAYKPFRPGDHIAVQGVEGRVVVIDLRYTTLADHGRLHLVPNSALLTNPVTVIQSGADQT